MIIQRAIAKDCRENTYLKGGDSGVEKGMEAISDRE